MRNIFNWQEHVIKQNEIDKYLVNGKDFINKDEIFNHIKNNRKPDKKRIQDIINKALTIERLNPDEVASLINVTDEDLWNEIYDASFKIKQKVYDNRIVFFAPLYCSNLCVNSCIYCGFRKENAKLHRRVLSMDEIKNETRVITGVGHKRMVIVFGEHQQSDIDYMTEAIRNVYSVKEKFPNNDRVIGEIRRVNVNAAPMEIAKLEKLYTSGIGTFQVFQETYNKPTYAKVHPRGIKANYQWRLYALHRAMDAGIDDLAIGALFGLYDWRFEIMGLLYHAIDLERYCGIGPHTISFPRLTPAPDSEYSTSSKYLVSDADMKKIVAILRLAVPYSGLICTVREKPEIHMELMKIGCTQTDASSNIGIGGYTEAMTQEAKKQRISIENNKSQFTLNDNRSLDEMVREMAKMGMISSFCTAGYRCGRTGDKIMNLLKTGTEGKFCKLNALLTYKEFLDDYASEETQIIGNRIIENEFNEIKSMPFYQKGKIYEKFTDKYKKICHGERDIYI